MNAASETPPAKNAETTTPSAHIASHRGLSSLSKRLIVANIIILITCSALVMGSWAFLLLVLFLFCASAYEFWRMFTHGGYNPSLTLLVGGALAIGLLRYYFAFEYSALALTIFTLISMGLPVLNYRRVEKTAAFDFNINMGGLLYIGWLGAYFISLRSLPDGIYWTLLVLASASMVDGGAYLVGSRIGKTKLSPILSPNKTVEGYLGGLVLGTIGSFGLAAAWHLVAPTILPWHGLVIGILTSLFTPLGDLGESMLKRGFGIKDSGRLLPGHGGVLDRIDSWLWAAPIGYYVITLFFLR